MILSRIVHAQVQLDHYHHLNGDMAVARRENGMLPVKGRLNQSKQAKTVKGMLKQSKASYTSQRHAKRVTCRLNQLYSTFTLGWSGSEDTVSTFDARKLGLFNDYYLGLSQKKKKLVSFLLSRGSESNIESSWTRTKKSEDLCAHYTS